MMIEIATGSIPRIIKPCWVFLSVNVISSPLQRSFNWHLLIIKYSFHPHPNVRKSLNFFYPRFRNGQLSSGHFYPERWWENLHRNLVAIQPGEWNRELPTDWFLLLVSFPV